MSCWIDNLMLTFSSALLALKVTSLLLSLFYLLHPTHYAYMLHSELQYCYENNTMDVSFLSSLYLVVYYSKETGFVREKAADRETKDC